MSAVDEDITVRLLQQEDPRLQCLAYRRKLDATVASELEKMVGSQTDSRDNDGQSISPRHEELWQKVQQCLGASHARQYNMSSALRHTEVTADHEVYLQQLSDDFVADVKALICQNLVKKQCDTATKQLAREVLHHTRLANEQLDTKSNEVHSASYSDLLQRLQSYVKDPQQSCRPFLICGRQCSDRSRVMSTVAAAVSHWLSNSGPVTVLRFIGSTTDSVDVQTCVASVRAQVQMSYGMEASTPCESLYSELSTFRSVLDHVSHSSAHSQPLFILLDGVDGLQPHGSALEALWAVRHLPSSVYLIMSVTSSGRQTGEVDILDALVSLITDPALVYDLSCHNANDFTGCQSFTGVVPPRLMSPVEALISTLDAVEADYGPTLVKHFAVYVAVMNVGIIDSELFDLLVTNGEVMAERGHVSFTAGIISILRQRLADFLASRLVYGRLGFSWSKPEYRQAVADRYQVNVGRTGPDALLSEESTELTLKLHQHIVQIYHDITQKSAVLGTNMSLEEGLDNESDVRLTVQTLGRWNAVKANRLLHHLRILLPVEGVSRVKCMLFSVDWLMTMLATSPVFHIINDVLSVLRLCQDIHLQQAVATESFEDIAVLFEFLQLSSAALSTNYQCLPAEVVTRLGPSSFVKKYPSVAQLVSECQWWLTNTESSAVVPLWPVWDHPRGIRRRVLEGMCHIVGVVGGGDAVVGISQDGVGVWRLQTGAMLHCFELRSEQPISGVIAAHQGAFVVTWCYSDVTKKTDLAVVSTEMGLSLLLASFHHHFEALALSEDDQLLVISSLRRDDTDSGSEASVRSIIGIDITRRDVVFQLPVVNEHSAGISNHFLIRVQSLALATCEALRFDLNSNRTS